MKKKAISPPGIFDSQPYGFSQVIVAKGASPVFISGQVAWDEHQNIIGENNLSLQTKKAIDNLETAIIAAGGTLDDLVMLRIYIVNYRPEYGAIISQILKERFGSKQPPASTWISVQGLANKQFMIEIEAQAVI